MAEITKVGIIACSGEEIPAGTISRLATRRVLELLRPQSTVTLCLPLFLAGEEQETPLRPAAPDHHRGRLRQALRQAGNRAVQRPGGGFAGGHRHPGRPASASVIVRHGISTNRTRRPSGFWPSGSPPRSMPFRRRSRKSPPSKLHPRPPAAVPAAALRPEGNLEINGQAVTVNGLPLIFDHLYKQGLRPGDGCAEQLLETVRIYHAIRARRRRRLPEALADAYQDYCRNGGISQVAT